MKTFWNLRTPGDLYECIKPIYFKIDDIDPEKRFVNLLGEFGLLCAACQAVAAWPRLYVLTVPVAKRRPSIVAPTGAASKGRETARSKTANAIHGDDVMRLQFTYTVKPHYTPRHGL